jgi:hypothetical protein
VQRPPRISFPRLFRRAPDSGTLPITLTPTPPDTAPTRERGGDRASAPASLRGIGGDSGSQYNRTFIDIPDTLNNGPVPDYINRDTRALNAGAVGPDVAGWPYDANREFMPHQIITRKPGNVTPYAKTIDTGVTVPSISIGAPVG